MVTWFFHYQVPTYFRTGPSDADREYVAQFSPTASSQANLAQAREVIKKRNYDVFEAGFSIARQNRATDLKLGTAFRLADLETAKKKAKAEQKMIGFIMVWDSMFQPAEPMGQGGADSLAGFYTVFS